MYTITSHRCSSRYSRFFAWAGVVVIGLVASTANAGFIGEVVGGPPPPNDNSIAEINAVITAYNTANMTSLPLLVDPPDPLLIKSDDDDFDPIPSDYMFFSDEAGTMMLDTAGEIHTSTMVWFKYTGTESILYYTVKGGNEGYDVYQYMTGMLNKAETPTGQQISHLSFWTGIKPPGSSVPELGTWSMSLAALAVGALLATRGRRLASA